MLRISHFVRLLLASALSLMAWGAQAQSFRVQCPMYTNTHPNPADVLDITTGLTTAVSPVNGAPIGSTYAAAYPGAIKCQQISGGDGFVTMGDGVQSYLFGFGPLSGLANLAQGLPATQLAVDFNVDNTVASPALPAGIDSINIGDPYIADAFHVTDYLFNGAIGLVPDPEGGNAINGHVDPRLIMDVGVMNANQPAPLMAIEEDDEFFLTLTNVGQIMRPDLFEQHTVHFHGYPNASSFFDGVPDASIAINIGGSFSYYYLSPDAGTYFWHCHISPPEHLQMGMVGQLYVMPRQNRVVGDLGAALKAQNTRASNGSTTGEVCSDILCTGQTPLPATAAAGTGNTGATNDATKKYAYNDGDGSTQYDVEYPIQIHGFDANFHFVGMTFNPESFTDMKDKYFLLNGRSYPDTVQPRAMQTQSTDGTMHTSQPLPTIINIPAGGRALLRISDLDVTEYQTLASLGIPMKVIGVNARLLRDMAGNNMAYITNSITLAGGESLDVILDASSFAPPGTGQKQKFYLYTPNLDHLSNDAENFGGLMTEVNICNTVDPTTKACN